MPVVIWIAVVVVVVAVVLVALGRGGGLSVERNDYLTLDLGPVSATDVALLRPPTGLWGYNMQATDEAMDLIAESIRERDVRIVALEQLVTDLSREPATPLSSPYVTARHRRASLDPAPAEPSPAAPPPHPPWAEPLPAAPLPAAPSATAPSATAPASVVWVEPPATAPWTETPGPPADNTSPAPPEQSHD